MCFSSVMYKEAYGCSLEVVNTVFHQVLSAEALAAARLEELLLRIDLHNDRAYDSRCVKDCRVMKGYREAYEGALHRESCMA